MNSVATSRIPKQPRWDPPTLYERLRHSSRFTSAPRRPHPLLSASCGDSKVAFPFRLSRCARVRCFPRDWPSRKRDFVVVPAGQLVNTPSNGRPSASFRSHACFIAGKSAPRTRGRNLVHSRRPPPPIIFGRKRKRDVSKRRLLRCRGAFVLLLPEPFVRSSKRETLDSVSCCVPTSLTGPLRKLEAIACIDRVQPVAKNTRLHRSSHCKAASDGRSWRCLIAPGCNGNNVVTGRSCRDCIINPLSTLEFVDTRCVSLIYFFPHMMAAFTQCFDGQFSRI